MNVGCGFADQWKQSFNVRENIIKAPSFQATWKFFMKHDAINQPATAMMQNKQMHILLFFC